MLKLVNNSCYFEIIINALHEALTELDIKHEVVKTYSLVDNKNIYLICTTHENTLLPKRYISYNFEQLITNKVWQPIFFQNLAKAEIVLDYSLENIKELEKYNIKAHFLPLGYSKNMENDKTVDKTVDNFINGKLLLVGRLDSIDTVFKAKEASAAFAVEIRNDKLAISARQERKASIHSLVSFLESALNVKIEVGGVRDIVVDNDNDDNDDEGVGVEFIVTGM